MKRVVVVENGGANMASLMFALERIGCRAQLTREPEVIRRATHVILPGVGAAADSMKRLQAAGLDELIPQLEQPVLGICLGMQLLFERSQEGDTACLGILPGTVRRLEPAPTRPVPHMGWNRLRTNGETPLLRGIEDGTYVYFVHGYAAPVERHTLAVTEYGDAFTAVCAQGNFFGVQFHPERSAQAGAQLLRNFLKL